MVSILSALMNVSQKDFEFMKECLLRDIITIMVEEHGLTMKEAFDILYTSPLLAKIENPDTHLYYQSPRYVLSYLQSDIERCKEN